jgi:hypothetical protein
MEHARVQPTCGQHRPPEAELKHRHRATRTKQNQDSTRRREAHPELAAREQQRQDVQCDRRADDERHEPEILTEAAQRRRIAPQTGITTTAVVAAIVVDANQHTARRADDRSFALAL